MEFQDKSNQEKNSKSVANRTFQSENNSEPEIFIEDNRPEAMLQRKIHQLAKAQYGSTLNVQNSTMNPAQLEPKGLTKEEAISVSTLYSTENSDKADDDFTEEDITQIQSGVFLLTDLFMGDDKINTNCIGWAQGSDQNINPGSKYTWEQGYTMVDDNDEDAKIILWGEVKKKKKETDPEEWDIRHASVKLTHAQLVDRAGTFKGFSQKKGEKLTAKMLSDAGVPNPCWSSAGGAGYGIFVHPQYWFEGGDFGTALSGAKKK